MSGDDDEAVEEARRELLQLYTEHAPEKLSEIPTLLERYSGREGKLVGAVRKKYSLKVHIDRIEPRSSEEPKARPKTVNVEDLMGADEDESDVEWTNDHLPNQEDMSIYF
jgi:hypothetical protein